MLSIVVALAGYTLTPTPLMRSPVVRAPAATMSLDYNSLFLADGGAGINGGLKAAAAAALGPQVSEAAPYIGTFIFVAIFALQSGALSGDKDKMPTMMKAPDERVVKSAVPEAAPEEAAPEEPAAE